jgi:hypothetical protein
VVDDMEETPYLARREDGREWGLQLPGPSTSTSGLGPSAITSAGDGDGEGLIGERGARGPSGELSGWTSSISAPGGDLSDVRILRDGQMSIMISILI